MDTFNDSVKATVGFEGAMDRKTEKVNVARVNNKYFVPCMRVYFLRAVSLFLFC